MIENQSPLDALKNKNTNQQPKKSTFKTIAQVSSWFFAVIAIIRGVTLIGGDATLGGLAFLIGGLAVLPPLVKQYGLPKIGSRISWVCPLIYIVALFFGTAFVSVAPSQISERARLLAQQIDKKKADELAVVTKKEEDKQKEANKQKNEADSKKAEEDRIKLDQKIQNDKIESDKKTKADLEANFCKLSFVDQVKSRLSQTYDLQYYTIEYDSEFKALTFTRDMDKETKNNNLVLWDEKQRLEILMSQATELGFMFFDSGNVTDLYVRYNTNLKDQYGKVSNEQAMQVVLPKNVFYKFNWANLDHSKTVYKTLRKEATVFVLPLYGIDENEVKYNYPNFKTQTLDQIKMKKC